MTGFSRMQLLSVPGIASRPWLRTQKDNSGPHTQGCTDQSQGPKESRHPASGPLCAPGRICHVGCRAEKMIKTEGNTTFSHFLFTHSARSPSQPWMGGLVPATAGTGPHTGNSHCHCRHLKLGLTDSKETQTHTACQRNFATCPGVVVGWGAKL